MSEKKGHTLVALYDATTEAAKFSDSALISELRILGRLFRDLELDVIGRAGSPIVGAVLTTVEDTGGRAIALSPAGSRTEHEKTFRLPLLSVPLLYTGKGALGADVIALTASEAAIIIGSESEALLGILGCIGERGMPIAILTNEPPMDIRERIKVHYPELLPELRISHDVNMLTTALYDELRKKHLQRRLSK